jgi:hypothetical protein
MIKPKISGQTRVIRVRPYLVFNFFYTRFFWLKGALGKHTIRPILAIIQRKKYVFIKQSLKKIKKIYIFKK